MQISAQEIAQALRCGKSGCDCGREISPGTWRTHCPVHDDEHPSFDLTQKGDKVLWHCHAGCTQEETGAALKDRNLLQSRNGDRHQTQGSGGLTLKEFAKAKHLDPSFLAKNGVNEATGKDN